MIAGIYAVGSEPDIFAGRVGRFIGMYKGGKTKCDKLSYST